MNRKTCQVLVKTVFLGTLLSVLATTINSSAGWHNFWKCHILTLPCETSEDQPEKGEQLPSSITRTTVVTSQQKCSSLRAQPCLKMKTNFSYLNIPISLCKIHKQCAVEVFAILSFLTLQSFLNTDVCKHTNTPWSFLSKQWVGIEGPQRTLVFELSERWDPKKWELTCTSVVEFLYKYFI